MLLGMDVFQVLRVVDYQQVADLAAICPGLNYQSASRQMHLLESDGTYSAGFFAFRRLCWKLPWLYLLIPVVYLPGMVLLGPGIYCLIAKLRFLFSSNRCCGRDACSYPGSVP